MRLWPFKPVFDNKRYHALMRKYASHKIATIAYHTSKEYPGPDEVHEYSPEAIARIKEAFKNRKPLPAKPIPLEDDL